MSEVFKNILNPLLRFGFQKVLNWAGTFGNSKIAGTDSTGLPIGRDMVIFAGITGTFETTGYSALGLESSWQNNFGVSGTGTIGSINDTIYGTTDIGVFTRCIKTQSGWTRDLITEYILPTASMGLTIINALTTPANWPNNRNYYDAVSGDMQQQYFDGTWYYTCTDGTLHRWIRTPIPTGTVVQDISMIKHTTEGGLAILLTNKTGANSVKGSSVSIYASLDNAVSLQTLAYDITGIMYQDGVPDGQPCWVVVDGIADVLFQDTIAPVRGYMAIGSATSGRASNTAISSNPAMTDFVKEFGRVLETKTAGTNITAKVLLNLKR